MYGDAGDVDFYYKILRKMATSEEASLGKHIRRWKPIFLDCINQSNYIDHSMFAAFMKMLGGFTLKYISNLLEFKIRK